MNKYYITMERNGYDETTAILISHSSISGWRGFQSMVEANDSIEALKKCPYTDHMSHFPTRFIGERQNEVDWEDLKTATLVGMTMNGNLGYDRLQVKLPDGRRAHIERLQDKKQREMVVTIDKTY